MTMIEPPLNSDRIPRHIAIIMDGNGRWAQARGISRNEGHKKGLEALRSVIRSANDLGVRWLTLYAFSLENWNRPKLEVASLMGLLERYLEIEIDEVMEKGIRLRSIGRPDRLPRTRRTREHRNTGQARAPRSPVQSNRSRPGSLRWFPCAHRDH